VASRWQEVVVVSPAWSQLDLSPLCVHARTLRAQVPASCGGQCAASLEGGRQRVAREPGVSILESESILTEIYLCHACSCHEIEDMETPGQVPGARTLLFDGGGQDLPPCLAAAPVEGGATSAAAQQLCTSSDPQLRQAAAALFGPPPPSNGSRLLPGWVPSCPMCSLRGGWCGCRAGAIGGTAKRVRSAAAVRAQRSPRPTDKPRPAQLTNHAPPN
jgi:hypothetical protein